MEVHLKIIGYLMIAIAFIHVSFPKYFNWRQELNSISLINRQLMYIHTFFIALIVFLTGILCLTSGIDLVSTALGKKVSLGLGIFWIVRLFIQFFGFSSKVWKGRKFETSIHIFFAVLWSYFSLVFLQTYFL